jgi:ABC-type polysaccharide/polyol phosphate transport system ATPase subunit
MNTAIKIDNVSMMFNLSSEKVDSIKDYIIKMFKRELHFQKFWALKNVSFELEKGDSLGIIGLNGSGKSTLLKIISGILKPTEGKVTTVGSIAPLIELGAGFDANLSARENVYLNGAILGYSREYMDSRFDEIIKFAELEDFVDTEIKNFSSGMVARLGFAIATMNIPDILIIDEILAVGDYKFQQKSFSRMQEMINSGATVIFVSHSIEQVKQICKKAVWLDHGNVVKFGPSEEVCAEYMRA